MAATVSTVCVYRERCHGIHRTRKRVKWLALTGRLFVVDVCDHNNDCYEHLQDEPLTPAAGLAPSLLPCPPHTPVATMKQSSGHGRPAISLHRFPLPVCTQTFPISPAPRAACDVSTVMHRAPRGPPGSDRLHTVDRTLGVGWAGGSNVFGCCASSAFCLATRIVCTRQ